MTPKKQRLLFNLLKAVATVLLIVILYLQYDKLSSNQDILNKIKLFYSRPDSLPIGSMILMLVLVNYGLESIKWCIILKPLERLSFLKAFRSVIVGVLFSIFTPARVGELGGRVIELKAGNRLVGSAAVLVGSVAQNIGILFLGLYGLIWFIHFNHLADNLVFISMLILTAVLFMIAILCFFNIDKFIPLGRKLPWPAIVKPYLQKLSLLSDYSMVTLGKILLLSLVRIAGWTLQYALIMYLLTGESISSIQVAVILMIFLIQTGIPLPPITGLIARSGVAVFMWSQVNVDEWNALTATFVIYFYNLIIPSVAGLFVLILNRNKINESL